MNNIVFTPFGPSVAIAYTDDSTDTSLELPFGDYGCPTALLVFNPDSANVVVVNYSFDALDTNAVVPISGVTAGTGTVVGPLTTQYIGINSPAYQQGPIYISVAGVSATGNVYVTPGVV